MANVFDDMVNRSGIAWSLLKDGINILLEGVPKDVDIAVLRAALIQIEGVKDVHDLHV